VSLTTLAADELNRDMWLWTYEIVHMPLSSSGTDRTGSPVASMSFMLQNSPALRISGSVSTDMPTGFDGKVIGGFGRRFQERLDCVSDQGGTPLRSTPHAARTPSESIT